MNDTLMAKSKNSRSWKLAEKLIYAAFRVLKEHDGELQGRKVIEEVGNRVDLDDWAKGRYEKSGYIRWQSILHFYTIDCMKAGFLMKKKGVWYLTQEGENALKLSESQLLHEANQAYRRWKTEQETDIAEENIAVSGENAKSSAATIDEYEVIAIEGLKASPLKVPGTTCDSLPAS